MSSLLAVAGGQSGTHVILAVLVVVVAARTVGWAMTRMGQPRVLGEIIAGILLGPSLLGAVWPAASDHLFPADAREGLAAIAQLGLVLFMFLVGDELDLDRLRGQGRRAILISQVGIAAPLVLGIGLALWLYPRFGDGADETGFVLFIGAALAITAMPVLARIVQETGLGGTRVGGLAITCAAADDIAAWFLLAGVVATVRSDGPGRVIATIGLTVGFVVLLVGVVRPLVARHGPPPPAVAIAAALAGAWATDRIGIHAIFGAFLVGVVLQDQRPAAATAGPEHGSEDGADRRPLAEQMETVVLVVLLPVFFVTAGLSTRIGLLDSGTAWLATGLIILAAIVGKLGGVGITARAVGETRADALRLGILMNSRGLTELVILTVGLELGVIGPTMFTAMVIMALVTTLMAAPLLRLVDLRSPHAPPVDLGSG